MIEPNKAPLRRPTRPSFSSGPCQKRLNWESDSINTVLIGRSHRSKPSKARLQEALTITRELLGLPDGYLIGIVPASDTGAIEMALWSLLGPNPVTVLAWESFGLDWVTDIKQLMGAEDTDERIAPYGTIPNLNDIPANNDIVFTWNGTTSGVVVSEHSWLNHKRTGLAICDATSAIFAYDLPFEKLDVVTYSWQKILGGEAAHGMIILSPRAVERLENYTPPWPLPKIFRMTKNGELIKGIFQGETINTPSMLCVEDYINALNWAQKLGGVPALIERTKRNAETIFAWVEGCDWIENLALDPTTRSITSVCLKIVHPTFLALDEAKQRQFIKDMAELLETHDAAYDIAAHAKALPGLRIWCGPTVETDDIEALLPWLDWAFAEMLNR